MKTQFTGFSKVILRCTIRDLIHFNLDESAANLESEACPCCKNKRAGQIINITENFHIIFTIFQIGVSFHPPEGLGFQQLYVDAETKFSKEPLHSFVFTSVPQGAYRTAPPTTTK